MTTVSESHPVSLKAGSHTNDLVTHAKAKDRLVPFLNSLAEIHDCLHAMNWRARTVGQEETVKLIPDSVEIEVPGQDGDRCTTADERTKNVGFSTEVKDGNADVAIRVELVWDLCGDLIDKVLQGGIPIFVSLGSREA